jgi:hypothetical protein
MFHNIPTGLKAQVVRVCLTWGKSGIRWVLAGVPMEWLILRFRVASEAFYPCSVTNLTASILNCFE